MGTEGAGRDGNGEQELAWRLDAIVESSSDAILGGTLDGVITFWNPSAARIMGYPADEVIGRRVSELIPPDRLDELARVMDQLRAGKRVEPYDTKRRRKDGSLVDLSVSVSPVLDAHGAVVGAATVARDITERVRAEADRRALETRLGQAERLETAGQLASGIAHDFKNLLGVIVGYAEMAQDLSTDQELDGVLRDIQVAADRAVALTSDLLTFGRARTQPQAIDLNALIARTTDLLAVAVGGRAELVFEPSQTDLPAVLADRGQVEQVLLNLAVNARDAMPQGGTLRIATNLVELDKGAARLHPGVSTGRYVELVVSDTGVGMTAAVAARVFERFYTTKLPGTGTGLGLSTVHGIITDAGGTIEVESEEDRGTTFRIYLPAIAGQIG